MKPREFTRLAERGAELLFAQDGIKSGRKMRLDLAAETGIPQLDLVCVMETAGALYEEQRSALLQMRNAA